MSIDPTRQVSRNFLSELQRRNVPRVGAASIVMAWLVTPIVETPAPASGFGDAAVRPVTILLADRPGPGAERIVGLAPMSIARVYATTGQVGPAYGWLTRADPGSRALTTQA